MPSCDSYYRKMKDSAAYQAVEGGTAEKHAYFKSDRELLNYLLKIERQYDQHQLSGTYSAAVGHR